MHDVFKYRRMAEELRREINQGGFPGGTLPSERELSERFEVNKRTARRALDILEEQQVISPVVGKERRVLKTTAVERFFDISCVLYCLDGKDSVNWLYGELYDELTLAFQKRGHSLRKVLVDVKTDELPLQVKVRPTDAYLAFGEISEAVTSQLKRPLFRFNSYLQGGKQLCDFRMESTRVVRELVLRLAAGGRRRLGYLGMDTSPYPHFLEQRLGFELGAKAAGVDAETFELPKPWEGPVCQQWVADNLDSLRRLDCLLLCGSFLETRLQAPLEANGVKLELFSVGGMDSPRNLVHHNTRKAAAVIAPYLEAMLKEKLPPAPVCMIDMLDINPIV